jgi:hypothetical protein
MSDDQQFTTVIVEIVRGVEGQAIYINHIRVCGPKPWGGGTCTASWKNVRIDRIMDAICPTNDQSVLAGEIEKAAMFSALQKIAQESPRVSGKTARHIARLTLAALGHSFDLVIEPVTMEART